MSPRPSVDVERESMCLVPPESASSIRVQKESADLHSSMTKMDLVSLFYLQESNLGDYAEPLGYMHMWVVVWMT